MVPMNNKPMINVITETTRSAVPDLVAYTNTADTNVIVTAIRNQARPASGFMRLHQMTGGFTAPVSFLQRWYDLFAHLACKDWTAWMKRTTGWQLQQARHIHAA